MNFYFNKNLYFTFKKGQLATFFIIVIIVLIIASFVAVNIGKIAKSKTYTSNAADGGALAAASTLAYAFNYVAKANEEAEKNYKNFQNLTNEHFQHSWFDLMTPAQVKTIKALEMVCDPWRVCEVPPLIGKRSGPAKRQDENYQGDGFEDEGETESGGGGGSGGGSSGGGSSGGGCPGGVCPLSWNRGTSNSSTSTDNQGDRKPCETIIKCLERFRDEMIMLKDKIIPNYHKFQQKYYEKIRETVHDDQDNQKDLYTNALVSGYKINFFNSGGPVKHGGMRQEFYNRVDQLIRIETVKNGKEETIQWSDPGGRNHIVKAKVEIAPVRTYKVKKTNTDYAPERNILAQAINTTENAIDELERARKEAEIASMYAPCRGCPWCCLLCGCPCLPFWVHCKRAQEHLNKALQYEMKAEALSRKAHYGLQENGEITSTKKTDTRPNILCWIIDIEHDRLVNSTSTVEDASNRGESTQLWNAEYPTVKSSSRATFNYENRGEIYPQKPEHDAALVEIDFE